MRKSQFIHLHLRLDLTALREEYARVLGPALVCDGVVVACGEKEQNMSAHGLFTQTRCENNQ